MTGLGIRNKVMPSRRTSSNTVGHTASTAPSPRIGSGLPPPYSEQGPAVNLASKPSMNSLNASKPKIGGYSPGLSPSPGPDPWGRRTSTASYASSNGTSTAGYANGHDDYFNKQRIPSIAASTSPNPAAGKKKPPPPPPKKIGSFQGEYVTAMYDFDSHTQGDLAFREGDRIKVVKKTNSSQDWWEGELRGVKGSFPANYCK